MSAAASPVIGAATAPAGTTAPVSNTRTPLTTLQTGIALTNALPAAIAFLLWLPQVRDHTRPPAAPPTGRSLLRDPLAWAVTLFMGLQSLLFYASIAWLPTVYREEGLSATDAGLLLSTMTFVAIPAGIVVSGLAGRARTQVWAAAGATLLGMVGLSGLILAPTAAPLLWSVVLGASQGMTFPLALTMIALRSGSVEVTGRLSAMAQSVGYALAALGPLAVGLVHDATAAWAPALGLLLALSVVQLAIGIAASENGIDELGLVATAQLLRQLHRLVTRGMRRDAVEEEELVETEAQENLHGGKLRAILGATRDEPVQRLLQRGLLRGTVDFGAVASGENGGFAGLVEAVAQAR